MTIHYLLRSKVKSDPSLQEKLISLPPRSKRVWFQLNEMYSIQKNDAFTIALEETLKEDRMIQNLKWSHIRELNQERNTKLRQFYVKCKMEWKIPSHYDLYLKYPLSNQDRWTNVKYIQKIRCQHTRHKVDVYIDALMDPSYFKNVPLEFPKDQWILIGLQTNKEWSNYHDLKYQTLLYYSKCFQNLWWNQGYMVHNVNEGSWRWIEKRETINSTILQMIHKIRQCKKYASYYMKEDTKELPLFMYPNMKMYRDVWKERKQKHAETLGELTLLWNITDQQRQILWKKGIYSWKQSSIKMEDFSFLGNWKKEVLYRMITIHQQSKHSIGRIKNFKESPFASLNDSSWNHIFLDFEYTETGCIYLSGFLCKDQYHSFWASKPSEEESLLLQLRERILSMSPLRIWYWHIDKSMWVKKCKQYPRLYLPQNANIEWYDLCHIIRNTMVFKGCFDFGLKNIARVLYKTGYIKESYDELGIKNGEESLDMIHKYWENPQRHFEEQLKQYNAFDCQLVSKIFQLLYHETDVLEMESLVGTV